jgi:hypothetical protein
MGWAGATDEERPRVAARGLRMLRVGPASPAGAARVVRAAKTGSAGTLRKLYGTPGERVPDLLQTRTAGAAREIHPDVH